MAKPISRVDILMLALLVLDDDELDQCFLRAFHKLQPGDQEKIEDVGLKAMDLAHLQRAEDALEVPAKLGMHIQIGGHRVVVHRALA